MIQETSKKAYRDVQFKIGRAQSEVYYYLRSVNNATNHEIAKALGWEINRVTPRVKELREMGKVLEAGKRNDMHTGRRSIAWTFVSKTQQEKLL